MPCCEISDHTQMSKTIIAVRHFGLGGRKSLETTVRPITRHVCRIRLLFLRMKMTRMLHFKAKSI